MREVLCSGCAATLSSHRELLVWRLRKLKPGWEGETPGWRGPGSWRVVGAGGREFRGP